MCSLPLVLSHTHLKRASASPKQVVEDTIKIFPICLLFLRLNQPGCLCLFLYIMCPSLRGVVEMLQKIPVCLVLGNPERGTVLQIQSDKHGMEWKKNHFPWPVSYTSQAHPSSCLVPCCSVRNESQWTGNALESICTYAAISSPSSEEECQPALVLELLEQEAALRILVTVKNIGALHYQRVVSIQCGTCLEFLPDGKSFRFFNPAANKLDQGIKNEPLKEHNWLRDFALAAHWAFSFANTILQQMICLPLSLGQLLFLLSIMVFSLFIVVSVNSTVC